jgi:hypothetical protein
VRPLASTCATRVGLGATYSVDLCHRSGLGCDLYYRLVPPEWAWLRLLASTCATGVGMSTQAMNFRPKIQLPPERA